MNTDTLNTETAKLLAKIDELKAFIEDRSRPDTIHFTTNVHMELRGPDGELKAVRDIKNLITTAGKTALTLTSGSSKYLKDFAFVGIGSGSTAAALADTALGAELARGAATLSNPSTSSIKYAATFAAGTGTGTIAEYGAFSASTAGTMLNRLIDGSPVVKGALDSLTVEITITL